MVNKKIQILGRIITCIMVEYNKIYKKRDGRVLVASGPREAQKRQQAAAVSPNELESIREELDNLRANFSNTCRSESQSVELDWAIEEITLEIEHRYVRRISELESTLKDREKYILKLEERIDKQDELISKLTNSIGAIPVSTGVTPIIVNDDIKRPNIDKIFIDPTSKGDEDKLESHVKTKEVKSEKPNMSANLNKLKDLMGSKLPN